MTADRDLRLRLLQDMEETADLLTEAAKDLGELAETDINSLNAKERDKHFDHVIKQLTAFVIEHNSLLLLLAKHIAEESINPTYEVHNATELLVDDNTKLTEQEIRGCFIGE